MLQKIQPKGASDRSVSHAVCLLPTAHGEWSLEQTAPTTEFWKDSVQKETGVQRGWPGGRGLGAKGAA